MLEKIYRSLWSKLGGRPWTFIWRDLWTQAEFLMQSLWFFSGVAIGIYLGWKWALIAWGIYFYGFINGHFFWGTEHKLGQGLDNKE